MPCDRSMHIVLPGRNVSVTGKAVSRASSGKVLRADGFIFKPRLFEKFFSSFINVA